MAFKSALRPRPDEHGPGCVDCGASLLDDPTLATFGARLADDGIVRSGNGSPLARCWPCQQKRMMHDWTESSPPT